MERIIDLGALDYWFVLNFYPYFEMLKALCHWIENIEKTKEKQYIINQNSNMNIEISIYIAQ